MNKKIVATLLICFIISNSMIVLADNTIDTTNDFDEWEQISENYKKSIKDDDSYFSDSLDLSSFYEIGFKTGKEEYHMFKLINFLIQLTHLKKIDKQEINIQVEGLTDEQSFFYEELRGLSDAVDIPIERLISIKNFLHSTMSKRCTITASTGAATKYNETFLTQNIDSNLGDFAVNFIWSILSAKLRVKRQSLRYRYVYFGIPILFEFPIMNEKGLGWGDTYIPHTENESRFVDKGPGVFGDAWGIEWIRLIIMTCENVSDTVQFYKGNLKPKTETAFWSDVWCDKNDGIIMIEMTNSYLATAYRNSTDITQSREDILWHVNHHQYLDSNLTGSILPSECPDSVIREKRAHELLLDNYGNITIDVCKKICRDHKGGYDPDKKDSADICRHPDKNSLALTRVSWIVQPKNLTVYYTRGPPCSFRYIKCDFSKIFNKDNW